MHSTEPHHETLFTSNMSISTEVPTTTRYRKEYQCMLPRWRGRQKSDNGKGTNGTSHTSEGSSVCCQVPVQRTWAWAGADTLSQRGPSRRGNTEAELRGSAAFGWALMRVQHQKANWLARAIHDDETVSSNRFDEILRVWQGSWL